MVGNGRQEDTRRGERNGLVGEVCGNGCFHFNNRKQTFEINNDLETTYCYWSVSL